MCKPLLSLFALLVPAAIIATAGVAKGEPESKMAVPQYDADGKLLKPEGYQNWVFVGASLGLSYTEEVRREGPGLFHHVYIQPEAYEQYVAEGTFPEKTMLVMENFTAGTKVNPNLHGYFEDKQVGFEVALKDKEQFEDGWAYFIFRGAPEKAPASAAAFPKASCWDCHNENALDDNVFVQFYPILKREMARQGRLPEIKSTEETEKYKE